jgi:hypothetical protein
VTIDAKAWGLALLAAMALTACDKAVTSGNANAPGSPGTGNAREVVAPAAPDTPPGGSSAQAGSASGTAVMGATGGGGSYSPHSGTGTAGGLGGSSGLGMTGSFPAAGASAPAGDSAR